MKLDIKNLAESMNSKFNKLYLLLVATFATLAANLALLLVTLRN